MTNSIRKLAGLLACLFLAACGLGERLTTSEVTVQRSPASVAAPLMLASVAEAERFLPGLKVVKSRPSDRELQYTFPGDGKQDPATLLFQFEPVDGGKSTKVTTKVFVPPVEMTVDGKRKILSGRLVGAAVSRIVSGMAGGKDAAETTQQFSGVLAALAISTDAVLRQKALAMADKPSLALEDFIERAGEEAQLAAADGNDPTQFDTPHDDSEDFSPEREHQRDDSASYDEGDSASE